MIIAGVGQELAMVVPPVVTSVPGVETPLLMGPNKTAAVVTVLNFRAAECDAEWNCIPPVSALPVNVTLPFKPNCVTSVEHGVQPFTVTSSIDGTTHYVSITLPLQFADFLLYE
jgi:hypothetical protein